MEEVPQPAGLRLGLELLHDGRDAPFAEVVAVAELRKIRRLVRQDSLVNEAVDLRDQRLGALGMLEIHAGAPSKRLL